MDSRKTSLAVRHQNFTEGWSQLYKAGDFYLDLSLKPDHHKAYLQGYLVADPAQLTQVQGRTLLHNEHAQLTAALSLTGSFRLEVPQGGTYQLEIALQDQVIRLDRIEI
jgi:predicted RecB family nuclease